MPTVAAALALLLAATPAFAQAIPCVPASPAPLAFDAYKPSHLQIVREYGGAIMSQAPIEALLKLDPYVPSEAELLRQVGRGIAWWPHPSYAPFGLVQHGMPCAPAPDAFPVAPPPPQVTTFSEMLALLQRQGTAAAPAASGEPAERIPGIAIDYDGRRWVSAGPAMPFVEGGFVRVGERAGSPVFQRAGGDARVIYIQTTPGMVAPFRAAR